MKKELIYEYDFDLSLKQTKKQRNKETRKQRNKDTKTQRHKRQRTSFSLRGKARPFKRVTSVCLSSGEERANTCSFGNTASNSDGVILRNVGPSIAIPSSVKIPHRLAIAFAVSILSPVTMRTLK